MWFIIQNKQLWKGGDVRMQISVKASDPCAKWVHLRSGWNSLGSVFRRTERLLSCVSISVYVFKLLLDPAEEAGVTLGHLDLTGSRGQRNIALRGRKRVHSRVKVISRSMIGSAPESIFSLCLETFFFHYNVYRLWWLKNVDRYNDLLFTKICTPRWTGVCHTCFNFSFSVLRELAFSRMLKRWMSFYSFVYFAVVFIF